MDDYVKDWARAGSVGRCGSDHCDWMKAFGAIDVGCTFDVGRIGLNVKDAARGGRGPELVFTFGDGATFAAGNRDRRAHDRFLRRPAVCECGGRRLGFGNSNRRLGFGTSGRRLGRSFGNSSRHSGRRLGELLRRGPDESWVMAEDVTRVSNHYIKMPAAVAVLRDPSVSSLFFVDLDAVTQFPWEASDMALKPKDENDVRLRAPVVFGLTSHDSLAWQVHGSRYSLRGQYAVDFMARWFENRCSFKDQYSLWQTILELAGDAGCVDYRGELWRDYGYWEAKHMSREKAHGQYRVHPRLADKIAHHTIKEGDPDGLREFHYRSSSGHDVTFEVENAIFLEGTGHSLTHTHLEHVTNERYLEALGILGRDTRRHPWNASGY
ncbi:10-hydroxy-9-(phosphonooxy)octadecanoate phosphatase [Aureococcus anophagefferens]|nr:10-hydroxy-9-(phosphonooxy)octadecanoate phosphatase [Aureococcus anophagefferens]